MAKGIFGERLKRERELREVTLEEISKATRIAPRFMEALENEEWQRLPSGVFGRGFVRSVARYLGLNEEDLLSEYDLARGESTIPVGTKAEERIPSPPKWIPVAAGVFVVALLVGLVVGGRYAWKVYQAHRAAKKSSAIVSLPGRGEAMPAEAMPAADAGRDAVGNPNGAPLELLVATANSTHVRVVGDGTVAFDAQLEQGQSRRFSATERFEVTAGDTSALLLELNGQKVGAAEGAGSSATIVLTAKDTRQANGGDAQR